MCEITTILAGLSVASAVATPLLAAKGEKQMAQQNNAAAQEAYGASLQQVALRQQQERTKAAQEIEAVSRRSLQSSSTAFASAADAGVSGRSLDALMADYRRRELEFVDRTQRQVRDNVYQLQLEKQGLAAQTRGRMMTGPNPWAVGMQAFGAGANVLANNNFATALGIRWDAGVEPASTFGGGRVPRSQSRSVTYG